MDSLLLAYHNLGNYLKPVSCLKQLLEQKIAGKRKQNDDDRQITCHGSTGCWQTPPVDIMEKILQNLGLISRMRITKVCMSWRSLAMRTDIRSAPQLPWLVHPQIPNTNYLSFSSLCEGEVVNLELPKQFRGQGEFKFRASSKGWLILLQEKGLNSEMFLFNPISRAQHQLPPLKTIPFFQEMVTELWKGRAENFVTKIVLSSPNISECIVAAFFHTEKELGLCRPGDKSWTVFEILYDEDEFLMDLLFSGGMLYGLVDRVGDKSSKNGISAARSLSFGDQTMAVGLKLVYGHKEYGNAHEFHDDYQIFLDRDYNSYLLESTTNSDKEVFLIHQRLDCLRLDYTDDDDDDDDCDDNWEFEYQRTRGFTVYKIDLECGNLDEVQNLGDQIIFLAEHSSSLSFPASDFELQGNCIYFATPGYEYDAINLPLKTPLGPNISREIGVLSLDSGKVKRCFPSLDFVGMSSPCQLSWFSPGL